MSTITVETTSSSDYERCACCGSASRTVRGIIRIDGDASAAYFIHWTPSQIDSKGASFDFILGRWGEGSNPRDRSVVSVEFRRHGALPEFMIVDAGPRSTPYLELAAHALSRQRVAGSDLAQRVFAMLDAIWLQDQRIEEISHCTS